MEYRVRLGDRGQRAGRPAAVGIARWRPAVRLDRRRAGPRHQAGRAGLILSRPAHHRAGRRRAVRWGAAMVDRPEDPPIPRKSERDPFRRVTMKRDSVVAPAAPSAVLRSRESGRERCGLRRIGRGRLPDIPHAASTPAMPLMRGHRPAEGRDVHLGRPALHDMRRSTAAPQVGCSGNPPRPADVGGAGRGPRQKTVGAPALRIAARPASRGHGELRPTPRRGMVPAQPSARLGSPVSGGNHAPG